MQTAITAAFASWMIPPWATFLLVVTGLIYWRGWREIRRTRPEQFPFWRLFCMLGALLTLWIAIASPLDTLSGMLLVVHMTQHLLLMSVAPPLFALSAPQVPLLRALPRSWVREGLGPFFTLAPMHALERLLKSRLFAWVAMNLAFVAWHVPAAYDLALRHPQLHEVEHACFFLTSLLFWWPIVEPWPVVYKGSRWLMLPYLMSADIVNTALSAFLSFSGRIVYPVYADAPRLFGLTALNDQIAAGSEMWVLGSTAFLAPIMWITLQMLSRRGERRQAARALAATQARTRPGFLAKPLVLAPAGSQVSRLDLLQLPAVGAFLKSRYGRQSLQLVLLLVASAVIVDGFFGHPMGSMNLAGIIPWTYARALFVLALLLFGNLFCMSCPFMLPRELGKRLASAAGLARLPWPRTLRNKWLSAVLLALFFWAYEALGLWNSPVRTASLLVAYFLTAFAVDSIFRGASFCKYVCPVGQFNFAASLLSPVSLEARSQATCSTCSTRDCIRDPSRDSSYGSKDQGGNETQRGCELDLFMPRKSGNLDCTLCMDCVKACPHDNIGLFVAAPARDLVQIAVYDPQRSSVGRYSRRPDVAALALVIVAAAFGSAAVMVVPVGEWLGRASGAIPDWLASSAGLASAAALPALLLGLLLAAIWAMTPGARPAQSVWPRGEADASFRAQVCRWALALLPLGLGMWAAHLSFHLLTGWNSIVPALEQAALDFHLHSASRPDWSAERALLTPNALLEVQMVLLDAGLLFALYLGWRIIRPGLHTSRARPVGESLAKMSPWAMLVVLLYAAGVWVLLQPMQMRGMVGM
jgi:cytochrome c oxidase assembly factor CtaG/ferredoxin